MCGFVGTISKRPLAIERLARAAKKIEHRGPDEELIKDYGTIQLGFRRLAIIDLATGSQPIRSASGAHSITFNGEIYNFKELRTELEAEGRHFRTQGDAEVILVGYEAWGDKILEKLNGIFAAAIVNHESNELLLFRDRVGTKPLFYQAEGDSLHFSSELDALRELSENEWRLNEEALSHFLSALYIPAPWTAYANVNSLRPGSWLRFKNGTLTHGTYFKNQFHYPKSNRSFASYQEELDDTLSKVVRDQLMSEVPVGFFLSGGVDSSLVALAAHRAGIPIRTFSAIIDDNELNETEFARKISMLTGSEHWEEKIDAAQMGRLPEISRYFGQPFADSSILPTTSICERISEHVTVVLGGDGSDEFHCGYDRYLKALQFKGSNKDFFENNYFRVPEVIRKRILSNKSLPSTYEAFLDEGAFDGELPPEQLMRYFDARFFLEGDVLQKVDICSMRSSLEARVPLLDNRMIAFASSLPMNALLNNGSGKFLLKENLAQKTSREFSFRQKVGFMLPIQKWIPAYQEQVLSSLRSGPLGGLSVIDPAEAISLLKERSSNEAGISQLILALFILHHWSKNHGK